MSPSAWHLSIITDGRTSSDWLLGPMLVCVCLGDVCIVIGSSLMFLVFFYLCVDKKSWSYLFYHNMEDFFRVDKPWASVMIAVARLVVGGSWL